MCFPALKYKKSSAKTNLPLVIQHVQASCGCMEIIPSNKQQT